MWFMIPDLLIYGFSLLNVPVVRPKAIFSILLCRQRISREQPHFQLLMVTDRIVRDIMDRISFLLAEQRFDKVSISQLASPRIYYQVPLMGSWVSDSQHSCPSEVSLSISTDLTPRHRDDNAESLEQQRYQTKHVRRPTNQILRLLHRSRRR